jgi:hypothetical protein
MVTAAAESTTGIAIIAGVFIVGGYLLLMVLWYLMVYRPGRRPPS